MPFFSVILVNFQTAEEIQDAVKSLSKQTFRDFEVIVLDNDKTTDLRAKLDEIELPSFKFIDENENHGFAKGSNIAARIAKGDWLCLLNPDATAASNWLEEIAKGINRHPQCQVFASCQLNAFDPSVLDGLGDSYSAYGFAWRNGFRHSISALPDRDMECFSPCGASAVYRRDLFLKYSGFDERFFCYCEDIDLGFRMQLDGYKCILISRAIVKHIGSASTGENSYFQAYHGNRNQVWCLVKNMPLIIIWLSLPVYVTIFYYSYIRNHRQIPHKGHIKGFHEGIRTAVRMRLTKRFTRLRRPSFSINFVRVLSWNPWHLSKSFIHLREIK